MLECFGYDENILVVEHLSEIKQLSDRNVIEKFFRLLNLNMSDEKFQSCLRVLKFFVQIHDVSLFEIHQRISMMDNLSNDRDDQWSNRKQQIFNLLLSVSCFNNEEESFNVEKIFITKSHIDEQFQRELEYLDKKLALVFKEIPFLI